MSKHSKWETTRRSKAVTDAKRAKQFTKVTRQIIVAVKEGKSPDPETNHKLRVAVEKAKQVNLPKSNIERAIASAAGDRGAEMFDVVHELIGPGGAGVVLLCQTENKNRLLGEIRAAISKLPGNLASGNAVLWQFANKGVVTVESADQDKLFLDATDLDAEDLSGPVEGLVDIIVPLEKTETAKQGLLTAGWKVRSAVPTLIPTNVVVLNQVDFEALEKLIDVLENLDDVNEVYTNGVLQTPLIPNPKS